MVTVVRLEQPLNALSAMDETLSGMETALKDVQLENVPISILAKLSGRVMDCSPLQYSKALSPIEVILHGRLTVVRLLQLEKVRKPIDVTPAGMEMDDRLVQPEKACSPI